MARKDNLYYDITIDTGGDFELSFTLYGEGSTVVDLTGAIVRAQLREYPEGTSATDFACLHNDDGGQITISMAHEVTRELGYSYGWFDVKVTYPDETVEEVMHGKAFITANITRPHNDGTPYTIVAFEDFDDFPAEGNLYRIYFDREYGMLYYWNGNQYLPLLQQLKGDAATIEVGEVITGDPWTPVIVTNSGDQHHAVFNFTIPRGEQGVIFPTGNWDPTRVYNKLDMVIYDGSSYTAMQPVPAGTPITDTTYWQLLAQRGEQGNTGYSEIVTSSFDPTENYEAGDVVIYQNEVYRLLQPYYGEGGWETVVARKLAVMDHKANNDVIARTFDTTTYYYAGDYVFRDGILYRFTVAHTAGAWDSTQVETVTVSNELLDLEDGLEAGLTKIRNIIARPFSEATSYTSGDYVVRDGYLYRFIENHAAGIWDSTQVELIIISDKLQRLDSTKALAYLDSIDYESTLLTNKPVLGTMATEDDAPSNDSEYVRKNGGWEVAEKPAWGNIGGFIADQTDLRAALLAKANTVDVYNKTDADTLLAAKANTADLGGMATKDDAPSNDSEYVRKNGGWEVASVSPGVPAGGTIGQILAKRSDTDGDAGWYSLRNLPTDKWYLPDGILESDVIAAYQFVNRLDEAEALLNVNEGTAYPLSKVLGTETWSANKGFYIPGTKNAGLTNDSLVSQYANMLSAAFGYTEASVDSTSNPYCPGIIPNRNRRLIIKAHVNNSVHSKPIVSALSGATYMTGSLVENGVLAGNWGTPPSMYRNGQSLSLTIPGSDDTPTSGYGKIFGHFYSGTCHSCYIIALVIYKVVLDAFQHLELSDNIRALGGIS